MLGLCLFDGGAVASHAAAIKDPDQRVDEITTTSSTSSEHQVSIDMDGTWTYAGYLRRRYLTGHDAYVNISSNQGGTWRTGDTRLNTLWTPGSFDGDMEHCYVSSSGDGDVYALMVRRDIINKDAYVTSSSDAGLNWSTPQNITAYANTDARSHVLGSVQGGKAFIVVQDERDSGGGFLGYWSVWLTTTSDGGQTWGPWIRVNESENALRERAELPDACADGTGSIHVAWRDKFDGSSAAAMPGDIRYRRFQSDGTALGPEVRLDTADTPRTESTSPSLACASGGEVFVAWADQRSGSSSVHFNLDTGSGWRGDGLLQGSDAGNATKPAAAIVVGSPTRLYVAWMDDRDGGQDLYFSRSTDLGITWSTPERLNLGVPAGAYPVSEFQMSADGLLVSLSFTDDRNNAAGSPRRDVFAIFSEDGGETFGSPTRLDLGSAPGTADATDLSQSSAAGAFVSIWSDYRRDATYPDVWANGYGPVPPTGNEDSDQVPSSKDNCPNFPNDNQYDADGDFRGDPCDSFPHDPWNDSDGDGYSAVDDVCPDRTDSFQDDSDADGIGDACDLCPGQPDPAGPQRDLDQDGIGDFCDDDVDGDSIANSVDTDDDNDGVADTSDNCATVPNSLQEDYDSDGQGDLCDGDDLLVAELAVMKPDPLSTNVAWTQEYAATRYVSYLGSARQKGTASGFCYRPDLLVPETGFHDDPVPGDAYWILVAAADSTSVGSLGKDSRGFERATPPGTCDAPAASDWDSDGVQNSIDNCPTLPNPAQTDSNGDGIGDECTY